MTSRPRPHPQNAEHPTAASRSDQALRLTDPSRIPQARPAYGTPRRAAITVDRTWSVAQAPFPSGLAPPAPAGR